MKKYKNLRVLVDSRDCIFPDDMELFEADFSDEYPDAQEELDQGLPPAKGAEIPMTMFFDSDHAHDRVTCRSITGVLAFLGRTPVLWMSKRQGAVETSTYGAEFNAMQTATEEAISLRYMLRCMGIPVMQPTWMIGDNLGVIQNASVPDSQLKKKHTTISYHRVREAVAAGIIAPYHQPGEYNPSDILTKAVASTTHIRHTHGIMH